MPRAQDLVVVCEVYGLELYNLHSHHNGEQAVAVRRAQCPASQLNDILDRRVERGRHQCHSSLPISSKPDSIYNGPFVSRAQSAVG